jgi:hypothetical protein
MTARLRQEDESTWWLSVDSTIAGSQYQMGSLKLEIPAEELAWRDDGLLEVLNLGHNDQKAVAPDGPIVLLNQRTTGRMPGGTSQPVPEPMPGFAVWLEAF